ncbi:MAG: hypothetical protein OEZ25_05330, partial [Candidatus Bathyarchaeota archaeon]|nr:hypothetical protein [Candidatus Bathyarchaeota archaeon]
MVPNKVRIQRVLKATSLILVYSSFLTPWLTQTLVPAVDIRFRFVFADVVIWLGELPTDVPRIQIDSSLNYILVVLPLVLEMLFTWFSMSKFKEKSRILEVTGAILGLVPVVLALLQFFRVGFSSPQDFQMSL